MAAELRQIRDGDAEATIKLRSPLNSALFDAVTIGIYGFYWYYAVNRELADLGRARRTEGLGTNPTNSFLAIFPGFFLLIPFLISGYNTGVRVKAAQRGAGIEETVNPVIGLIAMVLFFPVGIAYLQTELNRVWEAETEAAEPAIDEQPVA
jgi:hypothetical protein